MAPPRPYRLVYRAFDRFEFDQGKSAAILEVRGFDLGYVSRVFPGYVLERQDTRPYSEPRFQVIGELLGQVFEVVYTRRGKACRLITAWLAEENAMEIWNDHFAR
jgi:uncharacterized DUF497 family protein